MSTVNIGGPVALGILGAVLAFAVPNDLVEAIDLPLMGYILLAGAAVWLVFGLIANGRRSSHTVQSTVETDQGTQSDRRTEF